MFYTEENSHKDYDAFDKVTVDGHHESSLIQFKQGIPQMIYDELLEISELPFNPAKKQICL